VGQPGTARDSEGQRWRQALDPPYESQTKPGWDWGRKEWPQLGKGQEPVWPELVIIRGEQFGAVETGVA